ncbi:MAG: hypothetical protein ACXVP0_11180 [Bacteroidia bacterium]
MDSYKFLTKPLFFIFNMVFATWLVLEIEKIKPSDFGRYESFFKTGPDQNDINRKNKVYLKQLFSEYKSGVIDSTKLEQRLDEFTGIRK